MGAAKSNPVRLSFNPRLRVEFRGATVTSNAGLLLPRKLDGWFGLSALIKQHLIDPRSILLRAPKQLHFALFDPLMPDERRRRLRRSSGSCSDVRLWAAVTLPGETTKRQDARTQQEQR
jgi:hypothetical protein